MATGHKPANSPVLEKEYEALLREYLSGAGEIALGKAYELGRRALAGQKSIMEIASLHHAALHSLLSDEKQEQGLDKPIQAGGEFLAECLSPYEMAHRGFQDAVKALRQLNETLEEEIKRVAYAVHDEAGQLLVAVHLALADMRKELSKPQQEQIERIDGLLCEVEQQLRRYSHELRPTLLDDLGWLPAISFLAEGVSKRTSMPIHIETQVTRRLPSVTETALYRIVQEALNNIVKHAKAKNVWIRAWQAKQIFFCSVRDDGMGFDARNVQTASGRSGLGLVAIRERLSAVGGSLHIDSSPGRGTELSIQVPLEDGHANSSSAGR